MFSFRGLLAAGRGNSRVVMRRQLKCVGLLSLLLLAALSPVVATARRELPLMAAIGDDEGRQDVSSSGTAAAATAEGGEDGTVRRRKDDEAVKPNSRRFSRRTRSWKQMPAASPKFNFGGRIPFTADYHSFHRHPPTHN